MELSSQEFVQEDLLVIMFQKVLTRITLFGALFLGFIAVLPIIMQNITGINTIVLGGTALLIVVSVGARYNQES